MICEIDYYIEFVSSHITIFDIENLLLEFMKIFKLLKESTKFLMHEVF